MSCHNWQHASIMSAACTHAVHKLTEGIPAGMADIIQTRQNPANGMPAGEVLSKAFDLQITHLDIAAVGRQAPGLKDSVQH